MIQDEDKKLTQDQERWEAFKVQRQGEGQQLKTVKKP